MKKIEQVLDNFFSLNGELNQKSYFRHYFLDLFLFILIMVVLTVLFYVLIISDAANIKLFDIRLPALIYGLTGVLNLAMFIMNRLSIMIRRLKYLEMHTLYAVLVFIPPISFIFEFYLLAHTDKKTL